MHTKPSSKPWVGGGGAGTGEFGDGGPFSRLASGAVNRLGERPPSVRQKQGPRFNPGKIRSDRIR